MVGRWRRWPGRTRRWRGLPPPEPWRCPETSPIRRLWSPALTAAAEANGPIDLVVNAASAYGGSRQGPFGGGAIAEADLEGFDAWAAAPARAAFSFLSGSGRWLLAQGRPATVVQVTGGSARRAMAGRGLWAAGSFGVRAITNAAALELREHGIQVALVIVDAGIEPIAGGGRPGVPAGAARRSLRHRPRGGVPRRSGCARGHSRAADHAAGRALGAVAYRGDKRSQLSIVYSRVSCAPM